MSTIELWSFWVPSRKCKYCGETFEPKRNPRGGPANLTYCSPAHRVAHRDSAERRRAIRAGERA